MKVIAMANTLVPLGERSVFVIPDDDVEIDVRIENETVWLTQRQMGELFDTSSDNVGLHLKNIFESQELVEAATTEDFSVVQTEGRRKVNRRVKHYNLDAAISVGYRVNSKRGVVFRQWATRILRERLLDDHRKRSAQAEQYLASLRNVELLAHHADADAPAMLDLIGRYARSWRLLLQYDEDKLPPAPTLPTKRMQKLTLIQANTLIDRFKKTLARTGQATDLFGRIRDDGLASILGNLEQTFGGAPLYPNVDTRAANLLYMVIKNHPMATSA
jgi:Virulence protein RhuM family